MTSSPLARKNHSFPSCLFQKNRGEKKKKGLWKGGRTRRAGIWTPIPVKEGRNDPSTGEGTLKVPAKKKGGGSEEREDPGVESRETA